jgi:hypothetical protein
MEPEGMTAGAVAMATMLALLIWMPPQVHGKISAVRPSRQARHASRAGPWPRGRPLELGVHTGRATEASAALSPRARRRVLPQEVVMGWIDFGAVTW